MRTGSRLALLTSLIAASGSGCGALPGDHRWGEEVTDSPSADRVGRAALRAALEPGTLAAVLGAGLFTIDGWDRKVSSWAVERTPIFSSQPNARAMGTTLLQASFGIFGASILLTPSGDAPEAWAIDKTAGIAVEGAGIMTAVGATEVLKRGVGRVRPTGEGLSFPSSHSSTAFAAASLSVRNLDAIPMAPLLRGGLEAGTWTTAGLVAWSRVEAGAHFPSDVLAGAALGRFLTAFIHDAFLGLPERRLFDLDIIPERGGASLGIGFDF